MDNNPRTPAVRHNLSEAPSREGRSIHPYAIQVDAQMCGFVRPECRVRVKYRHACRTWVHASRATSRANEALVMLQTGAQIFPGVFLLGLST
jgi:hypothetical protein